MNTQSFSEPLNQYPPTNPSVDFGWIGESFNLFKDQWVNWVVATLVVIGVPMIVTWPFSAVMSSMMMPAMTKLSTMPGPPNMAQVMGLYRTILPMEFALGIIVYFVQAYLMSGMLRMAMRQVRGEPMGAGDVFSGWPTTFRVFGLSLIFYFGSMIIYLPVFALFGTAIITTPTPATVGWMIGVFAVLFLTLGTLLCLVFPAYVLVADGGMIWESISRSFNAVRHDWIRACGVSLVFGLMYLLSAVPCGLGLFVTFPMAALILALVYRDMLGMPRSPLLISRRVQEDNYPPGTWPPPPGTWPPPPGPQ